MPIASASRPAFIGNSLAQAELGAGVLAHAYLLTGPRQVGKRTLAERFAAQVACGLGPGGRACGTCALCRQAAATGAEPAGGAQADVVRLLGPHLVLASAAAGATTRIGDVAAVQAFLALSPVQPGHKVAVFERAETLSADAANRLLKTLEEPPRRTILVLCAPALRDVPPTLANRCHQLPLGRVAAPEIAAGLERQGADAAQAAHLGQLADGRPGWALGALADPSVLEQRAASLRWAADLVAAPAYERATAAAWLLDWCRDGQGAFLRGRLATVLRWSVLFWRAALAQAAGASPPAAVADVAPSSRAAAERVGAAGARQALAALAEASADSARLSETATVDALVWALP